MAQHTEPTAWVGWVYFASMMMLILGGLQALSGLVALFHKSFYITTQQGAVVWNYRTWGWLNLIFGILVAVTGMALTGGKTWARVTASVLIVLNAIDLLAFLPAYPIWSIIALIISGFILYAITVHGREVREEYDQ